MAASRSRTREEQARRRRRTLKRAALALSLVTSCGDWPEGGATFPPNGTWQPTGPRLPIGIPRVAALSNCRGRLTASGQRPGGHGRIALDSGSSKLVAPGEIRIAQLCRKPRHGLILRHSGQVGLDHDLSRLRVSHDPFAEGEQRLALRLHVLAVEESTSRTWRALNRSALIPDVIADVQCVDGNRKTPLEKSSSTRFGDISLCGPLYFDSDPSCRVNAPLDDSVMPVTIGWTLIALQERTSDFLPNDRPLRQHSLDWEF
jgi:hypothetical protein